MKNQNVHNVRHYIQFIMRTFPTSSFKTPCGIKISTSFAHALLAIYNLRGISINQQLLARELSLNKGTIARLCSDLEEQGFIKVDILEEDKRNKTIQLTTKGLKLAERIKKQSDLYFESVLTNIPKNKIDDVLKNLELLKKALTLSSQHGDNDE